MAENTKETKNTGKIEFGYDYLVIMRNLINRGIKSPEDKYNWYSDAIARFFLLQWAFNVDEIDQSNQLYMERLEKKQLPDNLRPTFNRVVEFVKGETGGIGKFVTELAAIGWLDNKITDDEREYVRQFSDLFDLKPSEFNDLTNRGLDWSIALNFVCEKYVEQTKKK